jgi:signal transduction histidine kinase
LASVDGLPVSHLDDKVEQLERKNRAMQRLVSAVGELSLARSVESVRTVVGRAARELTGADGATFVLRDGDKCSYVDEDAIGPLWKGQKFPLTACISGWAMLNRQAAAIEDIYSDPRIPVDAYRPTFVKSLVMVPIRVEAPIGAIGNYWAKRHAPTAEEVELIQALANTTAVAMENAQVYAELEQRVRDRTLQLEATNRELEAFSYSVSHDLRAPLRGIEGFASILVEDFGSVLDETAKGHLARICAQTKKMGQLIEDLLKLSRLTRTELNLQPVDLSQIARDIAARIQTGSERPAEFRIEDRVEGYGDPGLLKVVLENLLSNAWKYSSKASRTLIEFGCMAQAGASPVFFVKDNGAGFDMLYADKLFVPFQRLHREEEFTGHGIGLATVQRIIRRHGGRIWADARIGTGAAFYFTLDANSPSA